MAKDVLINNPDEQSAYKFIPGTTQPVKPTGSVDPANYTFTEEQLSADGQQPGNDDNQPTVVPKRTIDPKMQEAVNDPDVQKALYAQSLQARGGTVVKPAGTIDPSGYTFTEEQLLADEQKTNPTTPDSQQPGTDKNDHTFTESQLFGDKGSTPETNQPTDVATNTTGQQQQVTTPKTHLYNWGGEGVTLSSVLQGEGKDKPMSQIINDYYAWAGENGITPNVLDIYDAMRDKDTSKSYAQNEQDEKKRKRKETWDKVGMFLTHLGNAIGTYAGGGHMPIKTEDPVQWSERQRKLREATLAQRNAYNQSAFAMQTKMAAEQRAADMQKQQMEMKQAEQERKAKIYALEEELTRARINGEAKKADKIQAEIDRIKELTPYEIEVKKATAFQKRQGGKSGKTSSGGKGNGSTVTVKENEYNSDGKVVKSTTTKTTGTAGKTSRRGNSEPIPTGVTWKTKNK